MVTASLEYNQIDRPSTIGMLSFMEGKCYFRHEINKKNKNPIFIVPKLIFKKLDSLRKKREGIEQQTLKINEIKKNVAEMLTKLLKNKGIEEEKETKRKWSCYEFFLNCFLGKKNKDKVNIEDNETKIDLRRLKWDNTNIKHKPPPVECDTENTAKATFNSTKKEIGKKKGKIKMKNTRK
uniref:Uncharacterized protein n=1 Tax=Meloidogyne enterolobii TaxID=390850 RepID=A0A6V7VKA5_MELEN|nr:unnamed protein product [Meloidogyne enterolobii]